MKESFDDNELTFLNITIAKFVLPRLQEFKYFHKSHPSNLSLNEWFEIIDKMIKAFELVIEKEDNILNVKQAIQDDNGIQIGLQLFIKHYADLWG